MGSFGGFYKGEKKKKKKGNAKNINTFSSAPTLTMPEIISNKKRPA